MSHPTDALAAAESKPEMAVDPRLSSQGQWAQRRLGSALRVLSQLSETLGSGLKDADRELLSSDIDALTRQMTTVRSRLGRDAGSAS